MKFKELEITGFKSFFEKTNFLIENGLTGIVGPNGCGKSNIVESLRWCMGENSAKNMRGSGMEDVIFSGTSNRPSKNIAEVTLLLDNKTKDFSSQYNEFDDIITNHTMVHEQLNRFFTGFRPDAHPMAIMCGVVGALSAFYHDSTDVNDAEQRKIACLV